MRSMTSNELISSCKSRALIPTNQSTFKTVDFLRFANEEMDNALLSNVLRLHEDYYLITIEVPIVSGQSAYAVPYRAIGNKLRDVSYKDVSGNRYELSRVGIGDLPSFQTNSTTSQFRLFYMTGTDVNILPNVGDGATGYLEMSFYLSPNSLVDESRVATITSINRTTGEISVNSVPTMFSTSNLFDFVQTKSPNKVIDFDTPATTINMSTKTITFDPDNIPTTLAVGDYVNLAQETIVPQLPTELHSILSHRMAIRCLEALGDATGVQMATAKLQEMEYNLTSLIDNRVEDSPRKIVNRYSPLHSSTRGRRGNRNGRF